MQFRVKHLSFTTSSLWQDFYDGITREVCILFQDKDLNASVSVSNIMFHRQSRLLKLYETLQRKEKCVLVWKSSVLTMHLEFSVSFSSANPPGLICLGLILLQTSVTEHVVIAAQQPLAPCNQRSVCLLTKPPYVNRRELYCTQMHNLRTSAALLHYLVSLCFVACVSCRY